MVKKPTILGIVLVIAVFALFSAFTQPKSKASIQSKKSHSQRLWETSGHADATATAFNYWNASLSIPMTCAKCHSRIGFLDFLADGTVNNNAPVGTTVDCYACHTDQENGILHNHTSVIFPSTIQVDNLGGEALCMECHQGRTAKKTVDDAITNAGLSNNDTPSSKLSFINIHYFAAAASQFGTIAKGGYEYEGKTYDARFSHITGYNACITCHNPHSLEVDLNACSTCHTGKGDPRNITFPGSFFAGVKDPKDIRYYGSFVDYDGDGDMREGIYYEIEGFKDKLYEAMQAYAATVLGAPMVYDENTYPYFFNDTNGNGLPDSSEITSTNRYKSFSSRLLRAAYNYQVALKDPAGFAHGGKYIIELLYDSIEDLNIQIPSPLHGAVDTTGMHRTDEGHFDGSAEPWRHWDADGVVSSSCAKCHSAEGLPYFLENGTNVAAALSNGLLCTTCHTSPPGLRLVTQVTFPSGAVKTLGDSSNICLICHQGRTSKLSVDQAIAAGPGPYSFINIHYYPTGAVFFGSEVHGGYEFDGKIYAGQKFWPNHNARFDTCVECHMGTNSIRKIVSANSIQSRSQSTSSTTEYSNPNRYKSKSQDRFSSSPRARNARRGEAFNQLGDIYGDHNVKKPNPADCVYCHGQDVAQKNPGADPEKFSFSGIRPASTPDYDGDGNVTESVKNEIQGLEQALYAQIQYYATHVLLIPIVYDPQTHPYFFKDLNGNGVVDPGENTSANRFRFNAALLKSAYNFQVSKKEPHGFIHNSRYIAQLLVDSIGNLGGNVSAYTWR